MTPTPNTTAEPDLEATRTAQRRSSASSERSAQDTDVLGDATEFGRYAILQCIGRGGVGSVYAAYDPQLDRRVAIKVLHGAPDALVRDRFLREARALARLSHANVVSIHDAGDENGQLYIAMEFIDGVNLRQWARAAPRDWREALKIVAAAGRGLAAAHAAGLVHRDFKPHNVLVAHDGRVLVADFGLARATEEEQSEPPLDTIAVVEGERDGNENTGDALGKGLTLTGTVLGTPAYMAPEQLLGHPVDGRCDQFALCVTAWEVIFGNRPFEGATSRALLASIRSGPPSAPQGLECPTAVVRLLRKGLAYRPSRRHATLGSLLEGLAAEPNGIARRRGGWAALGLTTLAATGALAYVTVEPSPDACAAVEARLDGIWDDGRSEQIGASVLALEPEFVPRAWEHLRTQLDRYRSRWIAGAREACMARARDAEPTVPPKAQTACLTRARGELAAWLDVLEDGGAQAIAFAVDSFDGMTDPARCGIKKYLDSQGFGASTEVDAGVIAQVDELLARGKALGVGGNPRAAEDEVLRALRAADDGVYESGRARALVALGRLQTARGSDSEASETFVKAYASARAAELSGVAATASRLVVRVNTSLLRHGHASWWLRLAVVEAGHLNDPEVTTSLDIVAAHVLVAAGKRDAALPYLERAIAELRAPTSETVYQLAGRLSQLGALLSLQGNTDAAISTVERAVDTAARALGDTHPLVGKILRDLASLEERAGRLESALQHHRKVVVIMERAYGPLSGAVGEALLRLTNTADNAGRLAEAWTAATRAVEIYSADDATELELARALGVRAATEEDLGNGDAQISSLREAHALYVSALGDKHERTIMTLTALGLAHHRNGDAAAASAVFERVLLLGEYALGLWSIDAATTQSSLGTYLAESGREQAAVPHFERALAVFERIHGSDGMFGSVAHANLCAARSGTAPRAALPHCERAVELLAADDGVAPSTLAAVGNNLGAVLIDLGRPADAAEQFRATLALLDDTSVDHQRLMSTLNANLGETAELRGNHAQALPSYRAGLQILERVLGPDDPRLSFPALGVARVSLQLEDFATSSKVAQRILSWANKPGMSPANVAAAQAILSEAWLASGTRRREAQRLARKALAHYESQDAAGADKARALAEMLRRYRR